MYKIACIVMQEIILTARWFNTQSNIICVFFSMTYKKTVILLSAVKNVINILQKIVLNTIFTFAYI